MKQDCLREILISGLDDWVDAAEVAYIAREFGGATSEEEIYKISMEIVKIVLVGGLMIPGDITKNGFSKWDLTADASIEKIDREWISLGRSPDLGELFWLSITEKGRREAKEAIPK